MPCVVSLVQMQNGNTLDGSATFDAIAQQEQIKKDLPIKTVETNFKINTSNGTSCLLI